MKNETTCLTFLKKLQLDHHHFDAEVLRIREAFHQALDRGREDTERNQVSAALRRLRAELERHFKQEEHEGCLWEAVSYNASLCGDVRRILEQHPMLLQRLDSIIAAVENTDSRTAWAAQALQDFDGLARVLANHERSESAVLERSLPNA